MRLSNFVRFTCLCGVLAASGELSAQTEKPAGDKFTPAEITASIAKLGDASFTEREQAQARILQAGLSAVPLLEQGAKHTDLEIRYRCEQLKVRIAELEFQRRLEAFAADSQGEKTHQLELWDRFAEWYGKDAQARSLFVKMYRSEPQLLKALDAEQANLEPFITTRALTLQYELQTQKVEIGTIACLLFATGNDQLKLSDNTQRFILTSCFQPSFQEAMNGDPKEVMRRLLSRFILRSEGWTAQQAMQLATIHQLPEGLTLARKLLKNPPHAHILQMALVEIAKNGARDDIALIEPLLGDSAVTMDMTINKVRFQTQVRDCALASLLTLLAKDKQRLAGTLFENGDLKVFGFERIEANQSPPFAPHTLGFVDNEKREVVLKKWALLKQQLAAKVEPSGK